MNPAWTPSPEQIQSSNMTAFSRLVEEQSGESFASYNELHDWSVNNIETLWEMIWNHSEIIASESYQQVLRRNEDIYRSQWFVGAKLNFAENMLRYRGDKTAIISWTETGSIERLTYRGLFCKVASCAAGLKLLGIQPGDRIAAVIPNISEAIIAMLATTSLGAIWSSCSPDFGFQGVVNRFEQIKPRVLIASDGYRYNGKVYNSHALLSRIATKIDSIENLVIVNQIGNNDLDLPSAISWDQLTKSVTDSIEFAQLPFDHPVYIMYSSGTTGKPKGMVHGAGRVLLQHYKELALHTNLKREDTITYYTTCGWMMWNWLVSSLAIGATLFIYEGSPSFPDLGILWRAINQERISIFGTSPGYLSACRQEGMKPGKGFDLSCLKTILSTGAPLGVDNYEYVYSQVKPDVQLSSISGGTDLVSCFMLGNPNLPVHAGEIQCAGLGMKVELFDTDGKPIISGVGELVCTEPFPTMPLHFVNDPNYERYHDAYFGKYANVWCHGDFVERTESDGFIVHGRSDATLNPGGVRIGTAEIYGPVESMKDIADSLVIGQKRNGETRIVLFVVTNNDLCLDNELAGRIRDRIRTETSPRHLPVVIIRINEVPRTINGKKVELAVTNIVNGDPVTNRESIANPKSLEQFVNIPELSTLKTNPTES